MAKRRPRHQRERITKASKAGLKLETHPFSGIDPEMLREAMLRAANQSVTDFPKRFKRLDDICRSAFPPHVLTVLSVFGLRAGVTEAGMSPKAMMSRMEQHHVELLQALVLRLAPEDWGQEPAEPDQIQALIEELNGLADDFNRRRYVQVEKAETDQEKSVLALIEKLRLHTQVVRNWGYFSDVVRIAKDLYGPLDERLKPFHGFGTVDAIVTMEGVMALVNERVNEHWGQLRKIFRGKTAQRIARQYFKRWPGVDGDAEEFIAEIPPGTSLQAVKGRLLSHATIFLGVSLTVNAAEVSAKVGLPIDTVEKALTYLSLEPGQLKDATVEHIFMDNPIWTAPLMRLGDTFLCIVPQTMFGYIHDVAARMSKDAEKEVALADRRAGFLESELERVMRLALPGAQFWRGQKWHVGTDEYETDLVAKLDHTVVIAEAKSGALSGRGLRGEPVRVKRHVEDLVGEPAVQSARLERLIWKAKRADTSALEALKVFGEGFADIDQVVRISVTLDDFSVLASSENDMKKAGWITAETNLPCTLNIADLTCCVDILETPARFIHYFSERSRIQKAIDIHADELDYLGFYLETGFNIWNIESKKIRLSISGASAAVDRYYSSRDAGVAVPKPTLKLRPYFSSVIQRISERKQPHWLSYATLLLRSMGYEEQRQIENALTTLRAGVTRHWRDPNHECSIVVTPSPIRDAALLFYVFPPQHLNRRDEILEILSAQALENSGRSRCVILARNTSRWDEPYTYLAMAIEPGGAPFFIPHIEDSQGVIN